MKDNKLLVGKLFVECPTRNKEVDVRKTCATCERFRHITWEGLKPLIACGEKETNANIRGDKENPSVL